jgi:hypothetical protein
MSTYIKLSTNEYPRHIGDIEIDPAGMSDYAPVQWVDKPSYDPNRQRCAIGAPTQTNGEWITTWVLTQIPDSEEAVKVRQKRDEMLAKTDWSQGKDIADAVSASWVTYRQALRDVPAQAGFPWNIEWPVKD